MQIKRAGSDLFADRERSKKPPLDDSVKDCLASQVLERLIEFGTTRLDSLWGDGLNVWKKLGVYDADLDTTVGGARVLAVDQTLAPPIAILANAPKASPPVV